MKIIQLFLLVVPQGIAEDPSVAMKKVPMMRHASLSVSQMICNVDAMKAPMRTVSAIMMTGVIPPVDVAFVDQTALNSPRMTRRSLYSGKPVAENPLEE